MKICRYASSTGYLRTDLMLLKFMVLLVLFSSSLRWFFQGFSAWFFSITMAANILLISYVFLSISDYFLVFSSYRWLQFSTNSLFFCYSFSQFSLAMRMSSFRQPFYSLRVLDSFSRMSFLFFCNTQRLERSLLLLVFCSSAWFRYQSEFLRKVSVLRSCLLRIFSFYSSKAISKFLCSSDSVQVLTSFSIICACFRLFLSSSSLASPLLNFSESLSRSIMAMGEDSSLPLHFSRSPPVSSPKQMGSEVLNSSMETSSLSSKGFIIQQKDYNHKRGKFTRGGFWVSFGPFLAQRQFWDGGRVV